MGKKQRLISELPVSSCIPIDGNIPNLLVVPQNSTTVPLNQKQNFKNKKRK